MNPPSAVDVRTFAAEARIGAKQRTTLSSGRRLIHALIADPGQAFKGQSVRAGQRSDVLKQVWQRAMALGSHTDPDRNSTKPEIGLMFTGMFNNTLGVQDEDKWQPVKPLGNGSFGAAGLFKRIDNAGEADDYVVVKCACAEKHDIFNGDFPNISREAAIMMQLNEVANPSILYLRNYRYFESTKQFLYFLEYCPSFGTEFVRLNYKAMKQFIPEIFLWYMFYGLARGLVAMEDGPFGDYLTPGDNQALYMKRRYVVHRDIKPDNVFLGYAPSSTEPGISNGARYMGDALHYPHLKIADFGLSVITSLGDPRNKMKYHRKTGSEVWFPPEQRAHKIKDKSYYPFETTLFGGEDDPDFQQNHAYTTWGNTFVAGFVMYQFVTLDEPDTMSIYLSRIMRQQEREPPRTLLDVDEIDDRGEWLRQCNENFRNMTRNEQAFFDQRLDTYNMLLRWENRRSRLPSLSGLVEQCMAFKPEDRIDAHELLRQIEVIMHQKLVEMNSMSPADIEKASRVFTKGADLGLMRKGDANVEPEDVEFWHTLVRSYKWLDPSDPVIRPDLMGDNVPWEAFDFFTPGRREARNQAATREV